MVEELLPRAVALGRKLEIDGRASLGFGRFFNDLHGGLLGGAATLFNVALQAATDDIGPDRPPALALRNHMVKAQFAGGELAAAILAVIAVPGENIPSVELDLLTG